MGNYRLALIGFGNVGQGFVQILHERGEALAEAQARGYAEADPTGDVEGYDAAGKVVILLLGDVTLIGPGAGRLETGYALLGDLLAIDRRRGRRSVGA